MNRDDQFEKRLQRQPLREIPPAWREEILAAAEASRRPTPVPALNFTSILKRRLRESLWPAPQAWAGLAALWLVILGVNFATREPSSQNMTHRSGPPTPQVLELLKQQEQLLAELVGPVEESAADRPKSWSPQPRSQGREDLQNA
jgi:hypothetical protein